MKTSGNTRFWQRPTGATVNSLSSGESANCYNLFRKLFLHYLVMSMMHTSYYPAIPRLDLYPGEMSAHRQKTGTRTFTGALFTKAQLKTTQMAKVEERNSGIFTQWNSTHNKINELQLHTTWRNLTQFWEKKQNKQYSQYDANYIMFKNRQN